VLGKRPRVGEPERRRRLCVYGKRQAQKADDERRAHGDPILSAVEIFILAVHSAADRISRSLAMKNHLLAALALTAFVAPALAHHGWSEYDSSQALTLTGKIIESGYEHPHGHIRLQTPTKTWNAVLAPPTRMENRGLPKDALKVGNTATVVGYPNRNKPDEMRAERITIDGKTVELR
jgi:hypothetical protein